MRCVALITQSSVPGSWFSATTQSAEGTATPLSRVTMRTVSACWGTPSRRARAAPAGRVPAAVRRGAAGCARMLADLPRRPAESGEAQIPAPVARRNLRRVTAVSRWLSGALDIT